MKQNFNLRVQSFKYLKKLLLGLKITIIIIMIGASNVLATPPADDPVKDDAGKVPSVIELQQTSVTGTVTDATSGNAMVGVNVIVKGTTVGSITGIDGKYTISIPDNNAVLVFSFIGYDVFEQPFSGSTTINVALVQQLKGLDEVIVIGYGTQKKSDLTGSVTRINMDERAVLANVNVGQAMSGSSAGVNVQAGGLAGAAPDLSIRGQTSLSASDAPLIVLDGIIYNGNITDININDVESIDILKDASAAAVYGSRSANGVMLITTKRGTTAKPVISFNAYYGYQDMTNNPMKVMNADQYAIRLVDYYYQQDLYAWYKTDPTSDAGKPPRPDVTDKNAVALRLRSQEEVDNYLAGNEINWVDEVLQVAPIQNYNISVSGRTDRSNYFLSSSYTDEEGIQIGDKFRRITLHSNIENKINDWLTVGLITSYTHRDYSGLNARLSRARSCSPLGDNYIGTLDYDIDVTNETYMTYPFVDLFIDNSDLRNNLFLVGNAKISVPWITGLTYEFNYSNTYNNRNNNSFHSVRTTGGRGNNGRATKNPSETRNWIFNNIVTYNRTLGDHQVNATLLYSREKRFGNSSTLTAEQFDNDALGYNRMSLGTVATVNSSAWEENSLSYMARANYTYKSRYMITGTVRRDGFSGFGPAQKFATFPSVSVGWVATEEPFLSNIPWLYLKLRTSYGLNGNQGIGRYSSFSEMSTAAYVLGPTTVVGVYPSSLGNADLAWETTASFNFGMDYGLFDRRISGSFEVYKATTSDVLVSRALPPTTGYGSVWTNIGAIENTGYEIEVSSVNLVGRLGWETNFMFSLNRDKITKLYGDENDADIGNSWFVGEPIDAIYDYQIDGGLWTEEELYSGNIFGNWYPGQFKYEDLNDDDVISPTDDRQIIGYNSPNFRFSINNTFTYENFKLSFFINSIQGGGGYYLANNSSVINVNWRSDNVYRINASAVRPYWTPDNGVNNSTGIYNSPAVSSGLYESRSFVRLQDVSLSYSFPSALLNRLSLQSCQIYVASKNPYVWTNWSGWDPETGTSNNPMMRNITFGFRVTL